MRRGQIGCLGALLSLLASVTPAQEVPPPSADPGRVRKQYERGIEIRSDAGIASPHAEEMAPPPGAAGIFFTLESVRLEGSSVYEEGALRALWEPHLGRTVAVSEVFEIAASLTVRYRNDGYVLSRVIVPPQDLTDGAVRLSAIEGYVEQVSIEGEIDRPSLWEAHVERIRASRPIHADVLERALLLFNDLPGVSAQSLLRPSVDTPGASDLVVIVEHAPLSGFADLNNRGTRFLGRYQLELGLAANSWSGRYEQSELRIVKTWDNELSLFALTHVEQIGTKGTTLTLNAAYVDTEPGATLREFDVDGESVAASVSLSHPFVRTRGRNLSAFLLLDYIDSDTDLRRQKLSEDRLRVARTGVVYDYVDRYEGINLFFFQASRGFQVLGATGSDDLVSRPGAGSGFTKLEGSAFRLQRLGAGWNLRFQATGQYSFDRLLAPEEFGFGGEEFGRGYDPSELTGDHGLAGLVELQYGRFPRVPYLTSWQFFVSYDYGAVWRRDEDASGGRRVTASSAAIGARLNFTEALSGRVTLARPLTRAATVDRDDGFRHTRLFFGLSLRL